MGEVITPIIGDGGLSNQTMGIDYELAIEGDTFSSKMVEYLSTRVYQW
jgi:hypothetical protein